MSHNNTNGTDNSALNTQLTRQQLAEELEKTEQSITQTLQDIDRNFATAHKIISSKITPFIEKHDRESRRIWNGSAFWKQFMEASANVSLKGFEEHAAGEIVEDQEYEEEQEGYVQNEGEYKEGQVEEVREVEQADVEIGNNDDVQLADEQVEIVETFHSKTPIKAVDDSSISDHNDDSDHFPSPPPMTTRLLVSTTPKQAPSNIKPATQSLAQPPTRPMNNTLGNTSNNISATPLNNNQGLSFNSRRLTDFDNDDSIASSPFNSRIETGMASFTTPKKTNNNDNNNNNARPQTLAEVVGSQSVLRQRLQNGTAIGLSNGLGGTRLFHDESPAAGLPASLFSSSNNNNNNTKSDNTNANTNTNINTNTKNKTNTDKSQNNKTNFSAETDLENMFKDGIPKSVLRHQALDKNWGVTATPNKKRKVGDNIGILETPGTARRFAVEFSPRKAASTTGFGTGVGVSLGIDAVAGTSAGVGAGIGANTGKGKGGLDDDESENIVPPVLSDYTLTQLNQSAKKQKRLQKEIENKNLLFKQPGNKAAQNNIFGSNQTREHGALNSADTNASSRADDARNSFDNGGDSIRNDTFANETSDNFPSLPNIQSNINTLHKFPHLPQPFENSLNDSFGPPPPPQSFAKPLLQNVEKDFDDSFEKPFGQQDGKQDTRTFSQRFDESFQRPFNQPSTSNITTSTPATARHDSGFGNKFGENRFGSNGIPKNPFLIPHIKSSSRRTFSDNSVSTKDFSSRSTSKTVGDQDEEAVGETARKTVARPVLRTSLPSSNKEDSSDKEVSASKEVSSNKNVSSTKDVSSAKESALKRLSLLKSKARSLGFQGSKIPGPNSGNKAGSNVQGGEKVGNFGVSGTRRSIGTTNTTTSSITATRKSGEGVNRRSGVDVNTTREKEPENAVNSANTSNKGNDTNRDVNEDENSVIEEVQERNRDGKDDDNDVTKDEENNEGDQGSKGDLSRDDASANNHIASGTATKTNENTATSVAATPNNDKDFNDTQIFLAKASEPTKATETPKPVQKHTVATPLATHIFSAAAQTPMAVTEKPMVETETPMPAAAQTPKPVLETPTAATRSFANIRNIRMTPLNMLKSRTLGGEEDALLRNQTQSQSNTQSQSQSQSQTNIIGRRQSQGDILVGNRNEVENHTRRYTFNIPKTPKTPKTPVIHRRRYFDDDEFERKDVGKDGNEENVKNDGKEESEKAENDSEEGNNGKERSNGEKKTEKEGNDVLKDPTTPQATIPRPTSPNYSSRPNLTQLALTPKQVRTPRNRFSFSHSTSSNVNNTSNSNNNNLVLAAPSPGKLMQTPARKVARTIVDMAIRQSAQKMVREMEIKSVGVSSIEERVNAVGISNTINYSNNINTLSIDNNHNNNGVGSVGFSFGNFFENKMKRLSHEFEKRFEKLDQEFGNEITNFSPNLKLPSNILDDNNDNEGIDNGGSLNRLKNANTDNVNANDSLNVNDDDDDSTSFQEGDLKDILGTRVGGMTSDEDDDENSDFDMSR